MRDRLGGGEREGHYAAEEILFAADAERARFLAGKGLAWNEVQSSVAPQRRLVAAAEPVALQAGERLGDAHAGRDFVLRYAIPPRRRVGNDDAHFI